MHITNRIVRAVAILTIATIVLPMTASFGAGVAVSVAHAQNYGDGGQGGTGGLGGGGGLLGGLLGKLMENPAMLLMLLTLLMSLFQGGLGGDTAEGPVEEQAPLPPTGAERFGSGPRDQKEVERDIGDMADSQSLYIADGDAYPKSVQIPKNSSITVYNSDDSDYAVYIRNAGQDSALVESSVGANSAHVFEFERAGTYEICLGTLQEESCTITVTVQ